VSAGSIAAVSASVGAMIVVVPPARSVQSSLASVVSVQSASSALSADPDAWGLRLAFPAASAGSSVVARLLARCLLLTFGEDVIVPRAGAMWVHVGIPSH
jgi:hypothetical protein